LGPGPSRARGPLEPWPTWALGPLGPRPRGRGVRAQGNFIKSSNNQEGEERQRETREEIGISLPEIASYLGPIAPVSATPKKTGKELTVYPFVYWLNEKDPVTSPNYEVAQIIWGSLNGMYSGKSNTHYRFKVEEKYETFPGYDIGEQTVWGLTYRMIHILFQTIDSSWHFHS